MSDLKGYRCPNCGSMIPISRTNIYKCSYCGSEYEKENNYLKPIVVETCEAKLVTFEAKMCLNDHILIDEKYKEDYVKASLDSLAHQLAKQIIPFMEVKTYKDIATMSTIIGGKVRVAEPNTRLYDILSE